MEGWKLLVLLRLSPLVPYNLLNIAMAATKIPFWSFATASCFGELDARAAYGTAVFMLALLLLGTCQEAPPGAGSSLPGSMTAMA